jgi:PIN domain nuclease of toxin-antitoxin system
MVRYVLDSSAILRYLDDEAGAARVAEIIKSHLAGGCEAMVSALHWGEVAGITCKLHGRGAMDLVLSRLSAFGLPIMAADADQAVRASLIKLKLIKLKRQIPYVDAFGIDLASGSRDHVFVTADFDFKPASRDVTIEFLPAK